MGIIAIYGDLRLLRRCTVQDGANGHAHPMDMTSTHTPSPQGSACLDRPCDKSRWVRANILGVRFDLVDYEQVLAAVEAWRGRGERQYVTITNPHSVLLCRLDQEMRLATAGAGLTLPDGAGVILAACILGYDHRGRTPGPTLMLKLCDWGRQRGYRHFFYGGAPGVAEELARRLGGRFPGMEVAGAYSPPYRPLNAAEDQADVDRINACKADVVWVGLGAPKQEKWMSAHRGRIEATVLIGVGAAFDFHSGTVPWAPGWLRRLGLEWAWRLATDPRRMWRRNLDSPRFLLGVLSQRIRRAMARPSSAP
jgi:N-acetylglucosaminyldiphosphoundecaprenol N-acetyl-beta-D-mannosaminyltransferase